MQQVKKGDTVLVHYTGTFTDDGTQFDSSEGNDPLEFTVGDGMVIFGFDNGVLGMQVAEKKKVHIPCLEAYGEVNDDMFFEFEKSQLPEDLGEPQVGTILHMMDNEGNELPVAIDEIKENTVVLNANHPLAGKDLTFDIELVAIK